MESGPTILLCPHFVCLDVAGVAVARDPAVRPSMCRKRTRCSTSCCASGRERFGPVRLLSREEGIKPILRALRDGLPYFMLPDMDFGEKDADFVPFFGVPAATLTAPAASPAATGAKVIPVVATFLPNYQGWRVDVLSGVGKLPGRRHDRARPAA